MNNKFLQLGTLIIGATLIGLAPFGAIAQSPKLAHHLKESEQLALTKETQSKQSKLILAPNSEEKTRIQLYEKASPAVVAISTGLGHGSGFIVSPDGEEADFTQAIAINPEDAEFYFKRGNLRYKVKNYQGAEADYTQAIKLNPELAVAYYNRGVLRYKVKNYQGAEADYTQAIKINPEFAVTYYNRGVLRSEVKNYPGAEADFTEAIKINREFAAAYVGRGDLRAQVKNYSGAEADFTQAIKLNREYALAYYNRGILRYIILKNYQGAEADLQTAAQLFRKQDNIDAYQQVLQLLSKLQALPK